MEPSLSVLGVNVRTAPVAVRERFQISEGRRLEALKTLSRAEGVDEVILLATWDRTEFLVWASDITLAANSIMRFLSSECGLKLCEWKHFYRLLDEAAVLHIFRAACGLDPAAPGVQMVSLLKEAWKEAESAGATGRCLDAVMEKALTVSKRLVNESGQEYLAGIEAADTRNPAELEAAAEQAEKILRAEAQELRRTLAAQRAAPTIVALRQYLDEICRQELDSFRQENGPLTQDQDQMLCAVISRITQRITGSLARELKELPEQTEQQQMTAAVQRLFHLETPSPALVGTTS